MRIPLIDLVAEYHQLKPQIDEAIGRVLERGQFILGPEVEALEREIAAYCGTREAVAVASGTDALILSLRALGIGAGAEVITTAFSFFATAEAILLVGATPVFIDIDPATYTIDVERLADAITPRTKAIIPVHLFGHPCDMPAIMALAKTHRMAIIEDCAQAIGARVKGQRVGSFGDAGALSFYPTKNLGGYGDGGMIVTNDARLAEQARLLRAHGSKTRYHHVLVGMNSRLDELQAAILRVKLAHLDQWNQQRRALAARYAASCRARGVTQVVLPTERPGCEPVYHLYTIRLTARDRVRQWLEGRGIATQVCYPATIPSQPALTGRAYAAGSFPHAEAASREILALPIYPQLPANAVDALVAGMAEALA